MRCSLVLIAVFTMNLSICRAQQQCEEQWDVAKTQCTRWNSSRCNSSPTSVILMHETGGAGISDRSYVMVTMGTFAQSLCATLYVPPPYVVLTTSHNHGARLQCNWTWGRYFNTAKMSPVIVELNSANSTGINRCAGKVDAVAYRNMESTLSQGRRVARSMDEAYVFSAKHIPFIYKLSMHDMYQTVMKSACVNKTVIQNLRISGCDYVQREPCAVARQVANELVGSFERFAVLHVRRGDTLRLGCDPSPERVRLFLNCQLGRYDRIFPVIFFFSDDNDPMFVSDILAMLKQFTPHPVHGDTSSSSILKHIGIEQPDDDYLIYTVLNALRDLALASPPSIQLEFGGHGAEMKERCDRMIQCAGNGIPENRHPINTPNSTLLLIPGAEPKP